MLRRDPNRPRRIINRGETSLEPAAKLIRFLHLGNDENIFISQRCIPISTDNLDARLSFINDTAALRYSLPFGIIKNVILSYRLRRNDEAFLAIAYCLHRMNNIPARDLCKMKAEIYKDLPNLLRTDYDMFLFVYLSNKVVYLSNKVVYPSKKIIKDATSEAVEGGSATVQEVSEQTQDSETPEAGGSATIKEVIEQTQDSETPEAGGSATIKEVTEQTQYSKTPEAVERGSATIKEVSEQAQDSQTPKAGSSAAIECVSEQTQDSETPEAVDRGSATIEEVSEQTQDSETPEAVDHGSATINEVGEQTQDSEKDGKRQKTSFGRGMKKALFQWYDQRTALELANMFGRNRGMLGWTHRDIIHMCHMKFGSGTQSDKAQVIATLFKRVPAKKKKKKKKKKIRRQTPDSETPEAGGSATIQEVTEQAQDSESPEAGGSATNREVSEQTQDSETPEAGGSATIQEVTEQTQDSESPEAGGSATIKEVSEQTQDSETPEAGGSATIQEVTEQTQDSETPEAGGSATIQEVIEQTQDSETPEAGGSATNREVTEQTQDSETPEAGGSATIQEVTEQTQDSETPEAGGSATIQEVTEQTQDSETPEAGGSATNREVSEQTHSQISEAVKRIIEIRKLRDDKRCRADAEIAEIVLRNNLELEHIPAHFLGQPIIWDILMPTLTYQQLLRIIPTLQSFNFLKSTGALSTKVCYAIGNIRLISRSGVHPLEILAVSKLYEQNARYNEAVKNVWYQNKIAQPQHLRLNRYVLYRFAQAINYATIYSPQTGCNYFVTLDLREMARRKTVLRMSQVTCLEAMVLFALTLKKREEYTQIYTFVNDEDTLRRVDITMNMTFQTALEYCQRIMLERTKQSLLLPFKYVNKKNKDTVFITIVDSVIRFCQKGEAPIDELRLYRQNNHQQSKFIVLNLCRTSGDLKFSYEKGLLVVCGLAPDTWKIIDAFAASAFN